MPESDVAATYATTIRASPARVYDVILSTDFGAHPLVALLMGLRAVPALVAAPRATLRRWRASRGGTSLRLKTLLSDDFVILEEAVPAELVLGLTGRFWTPSGGLVPTDPTTFRDTPSPGLARAAWNFHLVALDPERTRLSTETRVRCGDPRTARRFKAYWRLVAPGSGLIRWAILRQIRRAAEQPVPA